MLHVGGMKRLATRIKEHYTTKIQPQGHAWMNFKTMKAELRGEKGGDGKGRGGKTTMTLKFTKLVWPHLHYLHLQKLYVQRVLHSQVLGGHEFFNLVHILLTSVLTTFSAMGLLIYFGALGGWKFTGKTRRKNSRQRRWNVRRATESWILT